MNKDIRDKELEFLARSRSGLAIIDFLQEKINSLNDLSKIETPEEMFGKKNAQEILKDILKFFMNKRKIKETKKEIEYN